jgi:imidazolonepropionase-like amidohydrolase
MRIPECFRAVVAAGLLVTAGAVAYPQQSPVTAFVDVTVVPMDRERLLQNQTVVVRNGRVAAMGGATDTEVPRGATTIQGRGRYLMPGLADMHAHVPAPPMSQQTIENVLFLFVANGVTFVRGMMGDPSHIALRDAVMAGTVSGPTLYVAGPPLEQNVVRDVDTARALVRTQVMQRFDLIKVVDVPADVYATVVDTAKELGVPVVGHVPRSVGVRRVMAAGQRSIEHLDGYLEASEADASPIRSADFATRSRELPFHIDSSKLNALVTETRDRGVWNVPTLGTLEVFFAAERGESIRNGLPELQYLPHTIVAEWVTSKNAFLDSSRNVMGFVTVGPGAAKLLQLRRELVRSLSDSGARLLVGSDAMQLFLVPGFSIHREMSFMAASGVSPYKVLEAATRNAAENAGQLAEGGTVAVGKRADLLLLDANPLENVSNAGRRVGVMVRGRWVPEADIQNRLKQIAAMRG